MATTILLVDDEPDFVEMVSMRLEAAGFAVVTAADGRQALAKAKRRKPDLVLLDVMMPDMDGGEVAAELKQNPETRDVPVMFLTAIVSEKEMRVRDSRPGDEIFLAKTIDPEELIERIEKQLAARGAADPARTPASR